MKRNSSLTYGFLIFLAAIPMILYLWHMFYNSADAKKAIRADWTNEYLNSIETDFSYLKNTDIYYKQGTIHFDFKIDSNTSLEDCKKNVKFTREFIIKKSVSKSFLPKEQEEHINVRVEFASNKNTYTFDCPYWINNTPSESDEFISNNYRFWYLSINNRAQTEIKFSD